jgi:hypothetical protein
MAHKQAAVKARRKTWARALTPGQEDAAAELVTALVALINATSCYCGDPPESVMAGLCGHCQGREAIAQAAVAGIVIVESDGA